MLGYYYYGSGSSDTPGAKEAPRPVSAVPLQPYLGLRTYQEEHSAIFCGRERESMELVRLVEADTASILYGVSGVGKSSLLRAGLFPRLRALDYLPVVVRLDHEETAPAPTLQVLTKLHEAALAEGVVGHPPPGERETLWEYFHHPDRTEYWTSDHRLLTPVLALDQFEEFFSLGEENAARRLRGTAFRAELISLLANRPPAGLDASIAWQRSPVAWKLILALREDFVAQLLPIVDELAEVLPSIHRQKLRLLPFDAAAVTEVVEKPWAAVGLQAPEPGAAEALAERWHVSERGIAPAQLSMLLTGAQSRLAEGQRLPVAWFADSSPEQISAHLDSVLTKEPPEARLGLEDHFISGKGFRLRVHAADAPLAEESLKRLSQEGILNFQRGNPSSYELSHDLLGHILRESRNRRREQEKAHELREAEERALTLDLARRKAVRAATYAALIALLAIAACVFAVLERRKAERSRNLAVEAEAKAKASEEQARYHETLAAKAADDAQARAREAEDQRKRAEEALAKVEASEKAAQISKEKALASRKAADELISYMQYDLSDTLSKLGQLRMMDGINSRIRKYHEDHPPEEGDMDALRERSVSLNQQGDLLLAQGNLSAASQAYQAAWQLIERLAKSDPDNTEWQRDLSLSFRKLGEAKLAKGNSEEALQKFNVSLEIAERLAKSDPSNYKWQRDWSFSIERVGDVKLAQGESAAALHDYEFSLQIRERLAKSDPENTDLQRDRSVSYDRIGDVKFSQGESAAALRNFQASLEIRGRLAKSDPGNTQWQRDWSVSYNKIGDVKLAQGDIIAALSDFRVSLEIRERLAKSDPDNSQWQRDWSISYNKIGDILLAEGDGAGALQNFQASLKIAERLAESDLYNTEWQRDWSISLYRIAQVMETQDKLSLALSFYERSLDIAERLLKLDPSNANWRKDVDFGRRKVVWIKARMESEK